MRLGHSELVSRTHTCACGRTFFVPLLTHFLFAPAMTHLQEDAFWFARSSVVRFFFFFTDMRNRFLCTISPRPLSVYCPDLQDWSIHRVQNVWLHYAARVKSSARALKYVMHLLESRVLRKGRWRKKDKRYDRTYQLLIQMVLTTHGCCFFF